MKVRRELVRGYNGREAVIKKRSDDYGVHATTDGKEAWSLERGGYTLAWDVAEAWVAAYAGPGDAIITIEALGCAAGWVERGWCRGDWALDEEGLAVEPDSPRACRWCMTAALYAAAFERHGLYGYSLALYAAAAAILGRELPLLGNWERIVANWNDLEAASGAEVAEKLRAAAQLVRLIRGQGASES